MGDHVWQTLPPEADVHQYQEHVAQQSRGHISALGAGQCQQCGRSLDVCRGGDECTFYTDDEWEELTGKGK